MNKFTLATLLTLVSLGTHAADFNTISNFGDSLSDIGNKHLITIDMNDKTSGKIGVRASEPNFNGHFSNGPVWTEYLAGFLAMPAPTRAHGKIESKLILQNQDGKRVTYHYNDKPLLGTNWAVGGAMSGLGHFIDIDASNGFSAESGLDVLANSGQQIKQRIANKGQFNGSELVSYMSGTNNLWFTLFGDLNQSGDKAAFYALADVKALIDAGAKQILAANIPNFVDAPWFAGQQDKTIQFIQSHNLALKTGLESLAATHPDIEIFYFDTFAVFNKVIDDVKNKGQYRDADLAVTITDVTSEAYSYATGEVIAQPNHNLFWDGLHPTTAMHKIIAKDAADLIKAGRAL
ncbi:SGNH/GDSL hydrolase family protein [Photobacterium sp.]|uniref:SGNH/GDSL hydrolase family protein n=1 Tax=Photobacterium sp. TaxID=660 RepID=UPI00299ED0DD|nr:SGNH/GDSL hydrolase family protein [Photobacterium sp.]MDX1302679.1 SGNH/GDSL hydrolase family protein [Photobacterium sp.]